MNFNSNCASLIIAGLTMLGLTATGLAESGYHWDFRPSGGLKPAVVPDGKVRCGKRVGKVKLPDAFRFEAEFLPSVDWASAEQNEAMRVRQNVLFDNLLVPMRRPRYNRGLYVALEAKGDIWTPKAYFGFGDDVMVATGPKMRIEPTRPVKFAFTFNAAGKVRWETAQQTTVSEIGRGGPLAESANIASVGERACSIYRSFWGTVLDVAIVPVPREWVALSVIGRSAFVRGETNATLTVKLEDFRTNRSEIRKLPVETRLKPGERQLSLDYAGIRLPVAYAIVPQTRCDFPIVAWGCSDWPIARELGFTHVYDYYLGSRMPRTQPGKTAAFHHRLDDAAKLGIKLIGVGGIGLYSDDQADGQYLRIPRDPKVARKPKVPEVSAPHFAEIARRTAIGNAEDFGDHPAFAGVLANSEVVDDAYPSFNHEHELYRRETGREVPPEVCRRVGSYAESVKRHPDGIIPEDDPVLGYYGWWWRDGNGWPRVNSAIAEGYRSVIGRRKDFFSFFDPAVRCPPRWGSGGSVDVLSQWVYANPEPLSVAGPCEELLAMIRGRPGQQAMVMTQLICYRSRLAPEWAKLAAPPEWARKLPKAGFITIPPDAFVEATWTMLAKPVKGIMYHGWGTIADTGELRGYCFTNPETTKRVRRVLNDVVAPLGPILARLPRREPEVAILESFTTAALGGPAGMGWSMPAYTFLERAHLDARILYEEELLRDGLKSTKILYLPQCRLVTPSVLARLREFQANGGILVADNEANAAIRPDIRVGIQKFATVPKSDHREDVDGQVQWNAKASELTRAAKSEMTSEAAKLRAALGARYRPKFDASSPEIALHARQWRETPYLFAINDRRDFGDYVGQWGLMMERGLPLAGEIRCADPDRRIAAVYELGRGGQVPFVREGDAVKVPVDFATTEGRLFVFLKNPIAELQVETPASIVRGETASVTVTVRDARSQPIDALLPIEARLYDARGTELDGGGWFAAEAGTVRLRFATNLDDPEGDYRLVVRDRASARERELSLPSGRTTAK